MSRTYKDIVRGKYKRASKLFYDNKNHFEDRWQRFYSYEPHTGLTLKNAQEVWHQTSSIRLALQCKRPWDFLTETEKLTICNYSKNPSWWNRLFYTRPSRRRTRDMLRLYMDRKLQEPDRDIVFDVVGKPCDYYY